MKRNLFFEYYGEHNISPVSQNIDDFGLHLKKREKLYRQCGIPRFAFQNIDMLEVGPGSGYNSLAFFSWGISHIDLVEGNPIGIENMKKLFSQRHISSEKFSIFETAVEDYNTDKKYDLVIAEGFIPGLSNKKEIVSKLGSLVKVGGVVVVTCHDWPGLFIEYIKRLIADIISRDIMDYDEKVRFLTSFFDPQLSTLENKSRPTCDWVQDQMLNPTLYDNDMFNIPEAIKMFGDGFDVLGSSPSFFIDLSWYKDTSFNYKSAYIKQYNENKMSLVLTGSPIVTFPEELTKKFDNKIQCMIDYIREYENSHDSKIVREVQNLLREIIEMLTPHSAYFIPLLSEMISALEEAEEIGYIQMENYKNLFRAFGRSLSYIAMVRNG